METQSGLFEEKRTFRRVPVDALAECEVFQVESQAVVMNKQKIKHKYKVMDLSLGGLRIIADRKLQTDEILRMKVVFNESAEAIWVYTQVRWCKFDDNMKCFYAGLQFFYLKEQDRLKCIRIIENNPN